VVRGAGPGALGLALCCAVRGPGRKRRLGRGGLDSPAPAPALTPTAPLVAPETSVLNVSKLTRSGASMAT